MSREDLTVVLVALRDALVMALVIMLSGIATKAIAQEPPPDPTANVPSILACQPKNVLMPWGTGSDYYLVKIDTAIGRVVWCPQANGGWNISVWQYSLIGIKPANNWSTDGALERSRGLLQAAAASASLWAAAASAVEQEFVIARVPLANADQVYQWQRLRHQACIDMTTKPYPVHLPGGDAPLDALPATWCDGFKPGAPPPPVVSQYIVTGIQAFALNPDGTRSITPLPNAPTKGAPCDCSVKAKNSSLNYCLIATNTVASCSIKP